MQSADKRLHCSHNAWNQALEDNCISTSNKWVGQTVQSYNRHATTIFCCQEPEGSEQIRATFNLKRVQRVGAQVHKYDILLSCVIATPAWTRNGFPTEHGNI